MTNISYILLYYVDTMFENWEALKEIGIYLLKLSYIHSYRIIQLSNFFLRYLWSLIIWMDVKSFNFATAMDFHSVLNQYFADLYF